MFKRLRMLAWLGTLSACVLASSGCFWLVLGAAAGAGGFAYANGVLEKEYSISAQELQEAAVEGVQDLGLLITSQDGDRLSAKIRSQFADGNDLKIDVQAVTEITSRIKIRVGIMGNKDKSMMVMNAIEKFL